MSSMEIKKKIQVSLELHIWNIIIHVYYSLLFPEVHVALVLY